MLRSKYFRLLMFLGLFALLDRPCAWGYRCADPEFKSKKCRIAHSYANSDVIFMGQLLSVDKRLSDSGWPVYTSEFFVKESYRGGTVGQIRVVSESGVNPPKDTAGHYVVFANKAGTGKYFSNPCSYYKFVKIDSPLVDSPLQTELKRLATTPGWHFDNENCVPDKTVIRNPEETPKIDDHAVYDSRD